ncbi:MAG: DJ-1/PfpI family protein [Actinomycetes bacterium]
MKQTAVILYPRFSEYEISVALSVLRQGGHPVVFDGLEEGPVTGEAGLRCIPDTTIDRMDLGRIDSVLVPGCDDIAYLVGADHLFRFLADADSAGLVLAAISSAPYHLARAGVLDGRRYTVAFGPEQRAFLGVFDEHGYTDDPVVTDGRVLTARGPWFARFGVELGGSSASSSTPGGTGPGRPTGSTRPGDLRGALPSGMTRPIPRF